MKKSILALTLLSCVLSAGAASAAVEVRFIKSADFSDVKESGLLDKQDTLKDIEAHFRKLAEKQLPGKDLLIEVTDVDLAGMVEPVGRRMEMIRVVREIGRPAMELRYVLSENGREIRSGQARLADMAFMTRFSRYSDGDPLRYEKRMMDDWFAKEFGEQKVATSGK